MSHVASHRPQHHEHPHAPRSLPHVRALHGQSQALAPEMVRIHHLFPLSFI